jgi:two-component system alkaline phosphatase synthesis response regulator PhoP
MGTNQLVLLVEGSNTQFNELQSVIIKSGFVSRRANDIATALFFARKYKPVLVLMDLGLNDKDAIDLLKDFDQHGVYNDSFAVVLSERTERYVEIAALNAGAGDFLIKPVNERVFASRLSSWIRRKTFSDKLKVKTEPENAFFLDRDRFAIMLPGGEVSLQRKEFEIISLLTSRPRKIFTRDEIKEYVWGETNRTKDRTIDVHVTNIRSKIGEKSIRTHKGLGYSFDI